MLSLGLGERHFLRSGVRHQFHWSLSVFESLQLFFLLTHQPKYGTSNSFSSLESKGIRVNFLSYLPSPTEALPISYLSLEGYCLAQGQAHSGHLVSVNRSQEGDNSKPRPIFNAFLVSNTAQLRSSLACYHMDTIISKSPR